jgi:hypothetical protein
MIHHWSNLLHEMVNRNGFRVELLAAVFSYSSYPTQSRNIKREKLEKKDKQESKIRSDIAHFEKISFRSQITSGKIFESFKNLGRIS